jgi:hypothetical protein
MGPEPLKERAERGSGDFLPASPPAEKATARQDQSGKTRASDSTRHGHARSSVKPCVITHSGMSPGKPRHAPATGASFLDQRTHP